jgi:hypothetical protein
VSAVSSHTIVMAGLVPASHEFSENRWMRGTSPRMTVKVRSLGEPKPNTLICLRKWLCLEIFDFLLLF